MEIADELLAFFGAERNRPERRTRSMPRAAQKGIPVCVSDSGGIARAQRRAVTARNYC
jgi:hypothetical protein